MSSEVDTSILDDSAATIGDLTNSVVELFGDSLDEGNASPSSTSLDYASKRVNSDLVVDVSNDKVYDFHETNSETGTGEDPKKTTKSKTTRSKTSRSKKIKLEPQETSENDDSRTSVGQTEVTETKTSRKRKAISVVPDRKRRRPRDAANQKPSSSRASPSPRKSVRVARASRKRPSSSLTTLDVPQVLHKTTALAAGDNEVGQLGLERNSACRFLPVPDTSEKVVACAAGGMHSLLLSDQGNVFSFGCNDDGSLGRVTEEEEDCFKPGRVLFDDVKIAKVAAGNIHSLALSTDCRVFIWGSYRDNSGAFGISPNNSSFITKPMELSVPDPIVDIACGADHTLMLSAEGTIYTMGCAEHGKLGRIRKSHCCRENRRARQVMLAPLPMKVMRKRRPVHFDRIWTGRYCSFARNVSDGAIWGCGLNNFHQLGEVDAADHEDNFVFHPIELAAFHIDKDWTQICGGEQHTLALDSDGTVYSMGRALYGRLGLGVAKSEDPDVVKLTPVPGLEKRVVSIAAGDHCSFALDKDGQLWCWGQGTNMLGQGDRDLASDTDVFVPTICSSKNLKDKKVIYMQAGSNHALCIAHD